MAKSFDDYFSVQVFLIVLRETLESAIIISVLLAFIHQSFLQPNHADKTEHSSNRTDHEEQSEALLADSDILGERHTTAQENDDTSTLSNSQDKEAESIHRYLKIQIWAGGLLGLVCCLICGSIILTVFYVLGNDLWAVTEHYWEGTFSILASIIISVMGIKILRVNKMQKKWKQKLSTIINRSDYLNKAIKQRNRSSTANLRERIAIWSEKYSMFILPFVTTLREGMEAIVFIGGIGINEDTQVMAIVSSAVSAMVIGTFIGILLYRSGNTMSLQWFLVISTALLYLVAAGLFSKGVWNFELQRFIDLCDGFDVSETGHGPGSYDITNSVWHVNCCNGEIQEDGAFWMIVTAVLGWTNSATYGSVISYIVYWLVVITVFTSLTFEDKHGYLPIIPIKWQTRRIKKRVAGYMCPTSRDDDLYSNVRGSIDSVNSATPLTS